LGDQFGNCLWGYQQFRLFLGVNDSPLVSYVTLIILRTGS
jgi:hypothetical protein